VYQSNFHLSACLVDDAFETQLGKMGFLPLHTYFHFLVSDFCLGFIEWEQVTAPVREK